MNHLYQDSPIYSHALCVTCSKLEAMKGWGLILWVKIRIAEIDLFWNRGSSLKESTYLPAADISTQASLVSCQVSSVIAS